MWYPCSNSNQMKPLNPHEVRFALFGRKDEKCRHCGAILLTLTVAAVASFSCMAQTGPPAVADSAARADSILHTRIRVVPFVDAIDAVLGDLPNNLRYVTGELLLAEAETDCYASLVAVPDAEKCIVRRYHSVEDSTASWQAKMFSGGDFGVAARKYQQLYQQLKTCYVRLPDGSIYYLEGTWEPAREGITFTTSTLTLRTDDQRFRDVKVELELVYQLADWAVNINIVTKKPDDEVQSGLLVAPPSTGMVAPVIYAARGEARNATRAASSSGRPIRPTGMLRARSASSSSSLTPGRGCRVSLTRSVRISPGATLLTVIWSGPNSSDSILAMPTTPIRRLVERTA